MIKLNKQMLKGEKGITLTSLVIYIIVFVIIIAIMANISNYFYSNIGGIKDSPKYVAEFNKFSMFFIADVKRNTEIVTISEDSLQFADGTKYEYRDNSIYRNNEEISKYVKSFSFEKKPYVINSFSKTLINVSSTFGTGNEQITRNIDFVLRYW
mgnify:CR=1 FL=1